MGILNTIGIKKPEQAAVPSRPGDAAARKPSAGSVRRPPASGGQQQSKSAGGKSKGKKRKGPADRVSSAAAPLQDRKRRLLTARDATLRDLGGLMLEMYKRNRFREELLLDKCEEILAIEVEVAHIDQRLFQLSPPTAAGVRPIGRCECSSPILPGQNFCGVCGRAFTTLTQSRVCTRCGAGLRPGDSFCASCGTQAPDVLEALTASGSGQAHFRQPPAATAAAAAQTVVLDAPLDLEPVTPPAASPAGIGNRVDALVEPTVPPLAPVEDSAPTPASAPIPVDGDVAHAEQETDERTTASVVDLDAEPAFTPLAPSHLTPAGGDEPGMAEAASTDAAHDAETAMGAAIDAATLESLFGGPQFTPPAAPTPERSVTSELVDTVEHQPVPVARPRERTTQDGAGDRGSSEAPAAPRDPKDARKLAKERAKRAEQVKKARMKAARERAKQRAKDAKNAKKRGDSDT